MKYHKLRFSNRKAKRDGDGETLQETPQAKEHLDKFSPSSLTASLFLIVVHFFFYSFVCYSLASRACLWLGVHQRMV